MNNWTVEPARAEDGRPYRTPTAFIVGLSVTCGFILLWTLALVGASGEGAAGPPLDCFVSIPPQAFFVERIGAERVNVHVMVGPGQSPHTYEPTARQLSLLADSRVYFSIGVAFEASLLPRIERSFRGVKVIDTSAGIEPRPIEHRGETESSGDLDSRGGAHVHTLQASDRLATSDPHVWLSPRLAVKIAENIRDALAELDKEHAETYAENCRRLEVELNRLDSEIASILAPYKGSEVFVFHPAYGYFTDAYGLVQTAVEERGAVPSSKHLAELIERARKQKIAAIFVQKQVSTTYAETVAKTIGARIVELDPLARDYAHNLLRTARTIAATLESK